MPKIIKAHSLTGRITPELMRQAFKTVKRNRGAAGVDKVSVGMFEANLDANLEALMRDLKGGTFQTRPLRRVNIPKPGSTKTRPLGIPIVRDRVAQEVLRRLLEPIFEPIFHDASHGFRKGRGCYSAIERVLELHEQGFRHVLDADIKGFFDNLPHKVIMNAVCQRVADGNILDIVEKFLKAGVMEDGVFKPTTIGTPQGGVISPLLANIVLNQMDWALAEAGYQHVRYADDFVVLGRTKAETQEALEVVRQCLSQLGLQLSEEKTRLTTYGKGYEFLGFRLSVQSRRMRRKSWEKFLDKIREITERKRNLDETVIKKLNRVIRGTANYFAQPFATCRWQFQKLDSWIRMRLRAMKKKRKNYGDNRRISVRYFCQKLGLLTLEQFCTYRDENGETRRVVPRNVAI
ncbi:MAG: group II intron reverse transcriptase/maturase [Lentisphaeria bacterium]|jgi:RNA-directed DNA polymerase|nr:group II intron reverse transcriptase/maturase [Bacteroidales bacterium]